jgi:hypothetical protein
MAARAGAQAAVIWLEVKVDEARARLERNAASPKRPLVPVNSFEQIVSLFEIPRGDERVIVYRPDEKPELWVEHVLLPAINRQEST